MEELKTIKEALEYLREARPRSPMPNKALAAVSALEEQMRWVPIDPDTMLRPHDTRESVLTYGESLGIVQRRAYTMGWPNSVTHYYPLPQPPTE